jgi:hypothetical protein
MDNLQNRCAKSQNSFPFIPVESQDREQALEEGNVEDAEMESHRQCNGVHENHVVPKREGEKRFAGREGVHSVKHLDDYEN